MPDQPQTDQPEPKAAGSKKRLPIVVALLMIVEAGAVFGVVKFLGGPGTAEAAQLAAEADTRETPVEVPLLEGRFQNLQTGRVWGWEAEIVLKVRNKNLEQVNATLERHAAEIQAGIALIFRRAQDRHLREPGLETLTHQLQVYVDEVFGHDTDDMPRVDRVLIPKIRGFPMDG